MSFFQIVNSIYQDFVTSFPSGVNQVNNQTKMHYRYEIIAHLVLVNAVSFISHLPHTDNLVRCINPIMQQVFALLWFKLPYNLYIVSQL